jgi:hypothetical protein
VNSNHLYQGTHEDNMRDRAQRHPRYQKDRNERVKQNPIVKEAKFTLFTEEGPGPWEDKEGLEVLPNDLDYYLGIGRKQ